VYLRIRRFKVRLAEQEVLKFAASIVVTDTKRLKFSSAESPVRDAVTVNNHNKSFSIISNKSYIATFPPAQEAPT
jgi:hypothetical protein